VDLRRIPKLMTHPLSTLDTKILIHLIFVSLSKIEPNLELAAQNEVRSEIWHDGTSVVPVFRC
jgi:hypothetical protein